MPMHDWPRVRSGVFHNFHVLWMSTITNRLNSGLLPRGYVAMAEQVVGGPEPDVVALQFDDFEQLNSGETGGSGGLAVVDAVEQFKPDVVISANTPLNAQSIILDHCQRNQIPFIYWLQDLISVAISSILSKKLPVFGSLVGHHDQRLGRWLLLQRQHVIAISDGFLRASMGNNARE